MLMQYLPSLADASEAKEWNGDFRLKKELHWISSLYPLINKLYRQQDIRFNNGAQFERATSNFDETFLGRERRAAGKDETGNVGAFYDGSQTDLEALPRKFKLYMVGSLTSLHAICKETYTPSLPLWTE